MQKYKIYTDGAFSPLTKSGGIAFIILNSEEKIVCEFFKKFTNTTSQRMEQLAVAIALESIKESSEIELYSDSAYVVNTYEQGWQRKKNIDLWNRIDKAKKEHSVKFIHIKGHDGNVYNELCDKLAVMINN